MHNKTIVIIGAGPAGLSAALESSKLGMKVIVLEKNSTPGGKGSSRRVGEFIIDYGPHVFHPATKSIRNIIEKYSNNLHFEPNIKQALFIEKLPMDYPFQLSQALKNLKVTTSLNIFFDYIFSKVKSIFRKPTRNNFKELGLASFGKKLYELCYGNYTEKVWGCSATEISVEFAYKKLPSLSFLKLLKESILGISDKNTSYLDSGFIYHRQGIGEIYKNIATELELRGVEIIYDARINELNINKNIVQSIVINDATINFDYLLSTAPLDELTRLVSSSFPKFLKYSDKIESRNLILIHVILDQCNFSEYHWSYLVNSNFYFNRVSEQKNLSSACAPKNKTLITFEKVCKYSDPEWSRDVLMWREFIERELIFFEITSDKIDDIFIDKLEKAYPFMYVGYELQKESCLRELSFFSNLITTGRYGLSIDSDMHDSMQLGREAVSYLTNGKVSDFYSQHEQICKARTD